MTKAHLKFISLLVSVVFVVLLAVLILSPSQEAKATAPSQSAETCKNCHYNQYDLWTVSKHGSVPIDCESCHRLTGEGAHPDVPYSIESQALTCETCHADKAQEWKSSRHGDINLGCATCHEPHSQQQKVLKDNQLICLNCHKSQFEAAHNSTHMAAGVSCEDCHLGKDSGHTFKATIASCESCHSDIHESGRLVAAGAAIEPVATQPAEAVDGATAEPAEAVNPSPTAGPADDVVVKKPGESGINLPPWLFLLVGLLIGGVGAWAIFGKDPGTPTPEK